MNSVFGKIFKIFDRKEKIIFFTLSFLIIINTFLELLSIGLIIPIISIIFSPDILPDYLLEIDIIKDFITSKNFVGYLLFLMLAIYFLKNFLLSLIHIIQTNYIFGLQKRLSTKIFNNFLSKDYFFHLINSRAKLIQIVINEVSNFVGRVISPIMILITETLVSLGIISIILLNDVDISGITNTQTLQWDGSKFSPVDPLKVKVNGVAVSDNAFELIFTGVGIGAQANAQGEVAFTFTQSIFANQDFNLPNPIPNESFIQWNSATTKFETVANSLNNLQDIDLTLRRPSGDTFHVNKPGRPVTLTGEPIEIALFITGRRDKALVEISGDDSAVNEMRSGNLGY